MMPSSSKEDPEEDACSPAAANDYKPYGRLQLRWDHMFERLKQYKEKHGNCLVPNRYQEDTALGGWVSTQRRQYKILTSGGTETTPMTPERASRLESIGFLWETRDPRHPPWEQRYKELCEYKEKYGNCSVPVGFKDNIKLSHWVSTQRQEYKNKRMGRVSRLTNERIELLNEIGFVWEAHRAAGRRKKKKDDSNPNESKQVKKPRKTVEPTTPRGNKRKKRQKVSPAAVASLLSVSNKHPDRLPGSASAPLFNPSCGAAAAAGQHQVQSLQSLLQPSDMDQQTAAILVAQALSNQTLNTQTLARTLPSFTDHPSVGDAPIPSTAYLLRQQHQHLQQQQHQQSEAAAPNDGSVIVQAPEESLHGGSSAWLETAIALASGGNTAPVDVGQNPRLFSLSGAPVSAATSLLPRRSSSSSPQSLSKMGAPSSIFSAVGAHLQHHNASAALQDHDHRVNLPHSAAPAPLSPQQPAAVAATALVLDEHRGADGRSRVDRPLRSSGSSSAWVTAEMARWHSDQQSAASVLNSPPPPEALAEISASGGGGDEIFDDAEEDVDDNLFAACLRKR